MLTTLLQDKKEIEDVEFHDNAPDHQALNLSNYPHHKYTESEDNITASNAPLLADVLKEIEELL